jgi:hypothetical protein
MFGARHPTPAASRAVAPNSDAKGFGFGLKDVQTSLELLNWEIDAWGPG